MSQALDITQTVSSRLSEVLADIGVDERIVMKRRRKYLLEESMHTISFPLQGKDVNCSAYYFGSQSEGTTTLGLQSDIDTLFCANSFNVIKDVSEWKPGYVSNYLMIQDESGYCFLQILRSDAPLPMIYVCDKHHFRDRSGRILQKNTIFQELTAVAVFDVGYTFQNPVVRHGPAYSLSAQSCNRDTEFVSAFFCNSWPLQAQQWIDHKGIGQWPSDDMRRYCSNTGCFVVGVGRKGSDYEELEWRISTSLAERCLMFSLNITQIRSYVLMKMLVKTYIKPYYADAISSYMCKTVLFQTIANTHSNFWRESNLIVCLTRCLLVLYNCVLNESCPHFIIPGNNLMAGHIANESKPHILEILQYIMINKEKALEGIKCDSLGIRLCGSLICCTNSR